MIFLWETIPPVKNILVKYEEFRDTTSYLSRQKNIAQFAYVEKVTFFIEHRSVLVKFLLRNDNMSVAIE